jgi:hypothetical protein
MNKEAQIELRHTLTTERVNACIPIAVLDYCENQNRPVNTDEFLDVINTHDPADEGKGILVFIPYVATLLSLTNLKINEISLYQPYSHFTSLFENPQNIPLKNQQGPYTKYPHICGVNVPSRGHSHVFFAGKPEDITVYINQEYRVNSHIEIASIKRWFT